MGLISKNSKFLAIFIFLSLFIASLAIFHQSFSTFFTQDDFILINQFSQNNLTVDIRNAIGFPQVTHWRPIDNFYYLIAGNLFGKNFIFYHLITFLIHISAGFLIYKIIWSLFQDKVKAVVSAFLYSVHPAHFITLFWISGNAISIGFLFFLISFYSYLKERKKTVIAFYILSLLASEAMLAGTIIFFCYDFFYKRKIDWNFLSKILGIGAVFAFVKIFLLTLPGISDAYKLELSPKIIRILIYYLLRIAGFGDFSSDHIESLLLVSWLIIPAFFLLKNLVSRSNLKEIVFSFSIMAAGLFPFILLPDHLSPHYMNISIFAYSLLAPILIETLSQKKQFCFLALFVLIAFFIVNKTYKNNWVVQRSKVAEKYINAISDSEAPAGSTIVFNDNYISSSQEAYFSLGTGKALDFWFKDKNYKSCFTWFENCDSVQ